METRSKVYSRDKGEVKKMGKVQSKIHRRNYIRKGKRGVGKMAKLRKPTDAQLRWRDKVRKVQEGSDAIEGIRPLSMLSPLARTRRSMEWENSYLLCRSSSKRSSRSNAKRLSSLSVARRKTKKHKRKSSKRRV